MTPARSPRLGKTRVPRKHEQNPLARITQLTELESNERDSIRCRSFRLSPILLLESTEFAPAGVLLGLSRVGIFFALQPEPKTVISAAARA